MDLSGEYRIEAPREEVWRALNDPEMLKNAIPGCQEVTQDSETVFTAKVRTRIGPVAATFGGKVTLSDLDPPGGYTISGEGQGGVAGFARGSASVTLEDAGPATILRYRADGRVGGRLAQVGSRLIEGSARKIADDFFGRFNELLAVTAPEPEPAPAPEPPPEEPPGSVAPAAPQIPPPLRDAHGSRLGRLWFGLVGLAAAALMVAAALSP